MRRYKYRIPQLPDDEYFDQLAKQHGGCAICDRRPKNKRLAGDHNHTTGKRRGLLCFPCNRYIVGAIERFRVPPERIAAYFRTYSE